MAEASGPHIADSHEVIRVVGARENNLKNVERRDPEAPADGLHRGERVGQVVARVRHDRERVAAAHQRDLPDVRAAVHGAAQPARGRRARERQPRDHRRPGAHGRELPLDGRHRDRRARDAAHPLQPHRPAARRLAAGVLVQHPLGLGRGRRHVREGRARRSRSAARSRSPAACARAARDSARRATSTSTSCSTSTKSLADGALTIPGYNVDGWMVQRLHRVGLRRPRQADPGLHRAGAAGLPLQGADEGQDPGHQHDLRGARPEDHEVACSRRTATRCSRTSARSSTAPSSSRPAPTAAARG